MDNLPQPIVSVCIPTYRGAAHLAAAIDSVLSQSFHDFELVIIDDNSPDETAALVARYSDPRVRYLKNPSNLGPEGNWNRCLEEVRGRYFKLLPQDDTLYPDTLKTQASILESDTTKNLALVFGARNIIDAKGHIITSRGYSGAEGVHERQNIVRRCVRYGTNQIGEPGSVLMRRELTEKVGHFDATIPYVLDLDYWVRLLRHGDAYYIATPVSTFRISGGSWSVAIGNRQSTEYRGFVAKLNAQGHWRIRATDLLIGNIMARLNNLLRLAFYRLVLRS